MESTNRSPQAPRVIETPSATTSPDNSKSGSAAYLIAVVSLVVCGLLGTALGSCTKLVGAAVGQAIAEDPGWYEEFEDDVAPSLPDDWEGEGVSDSFTPNVQSYTIADALDAELATYQSVDMLLAASAYANAQPQVSSSVREIVLVDRDATASITGLLHSAAWGNADLADSLEQAEQEAASTIEALQATQVPSPDNKDVARELEQGRSDTIDRWRAIQAELELLSKNEQVNGSELTEADEAVANASTAAAEHFESALSASRPQ